MKQRLKNEFLAFVSCFMMLYTLVACESDNKVFDEFGATASYETISESEAQKSFAKILSIAASKSAPVRAFLKKEAERQYDKDYDVFYPYVKNKVIENGKTLREILVAYSSEKEINTIENSVPLLTIMIPDLSAFGAFSINEWDTTDNQVAVTYSSGNSESVFYAEGDSLLSLPDGDLPDFPFLVVKRNERMRIVGKTGATRAGVNMYEYDFANPAFDGTKEPCTRSTTFDEDNREKAPEEKAYLSKEEIDQRCIEAYNLFKNNRYLIDREYIYYNLSPSNSKEGRLDPNIREKLYKFKILPEKYLQINENQTGEDPRLKKDMKYIKGHPSQEQIAKDLWTDGNFEFYFQSFMGSSNLVEEKPISVSGADLFYISKFRVKKKHKTMFRHSKWWYSAKPVNLKGKWVDLSKKNLYITKTWDLLSNTVSVYIKMFEKDKGETVTKTVSYASSYINKANVGAGLNLGKNGEGANGNFSLGFSNQQTGDKKFSTTTQYQDKDDELGSGYLNFRDPVVISDREANTEGKGYEVHSLSTGGIELVIAPKSIR